MGALSPGGFNVARISGIEVARISGTHSLRSPVLAARTKVIDQLKRHAIQVLRKAGHPLHEIAKLVTVGQRTVHRVVDEPVIADRDIHPPSAARHIGRPSTAYSSRSSGVIEARGSPAPPARRAAQGCGGSSGGGWGIPKT